MEDAPGERSVLFAFYPTPGSVHVKSPRSNAEADSDHWS